MTNKQDLDARMGMEIGINEGSVSFRLLISVNETPSLRKLAKKEGIFLSPRLWNKITWITLTSTAGERQTWSLAEITDAPDSWSRFNNLTSFLNHIGLRDITDDSLSSYHWSKVQVIDESS